ncbi:DUF885 domain-containing protein [Silvibacterium dinghuense]|uniref:DUF885 domain-containing protein n=2 Tax=Silvibacterium dinghuense TaxID=1560006 RepID=A0A4Q1SEK2_9BACT|nr:DUF885 domain-containing protein [Silvibacterium dinghuense]
MATYVGDTRYNDRLTDYSAAAFARDTEHAKAALQGFDAIDPKTLSNEAQLNRTLIMRSLERKIEDAPFRKWEMPVDQMNGPHLDYAALASQMPFRTVQDYENYIARLHALPTAFAQITEDMRLGLRDHLMPPRSLLAIAVTEIHDIADKSPEESPFAAPIKSFPASISAADQDRLRKGILDAIAQDVTPAYAKFEAFVKNDYAPHGRTEDGIWSLPDGAARYRQAIKDNTTTELSPDAIHAMGLKQVKEIDEQMLALAKSQGYSDLKSFNEHIRNDRDLYGKSGEQVLGLYQHYEDQMVAKLPELFHRLPKNKLEVVPMDAFRAPDAVPADYSPGAANRPGRVNVNEYDPTHRLLLNVEAIAYHEGIPGHHMQFSIAQERSDLPTFRQFADYNAYSEGWALYAERLGKEVGFYQDPYSEYGRLENEMWRSIRLVVDTGVHQDHWTREQMIQFFRDHTAMDEKNIESEVDRYIAWPGQALAYKLGQMKILELRAYAKEQLGAKFDIRSFHDAVLAEGPLPLDVLDARIRGWVDAQKKAQ